MFLITTRNFPPELGGMQVLMGGLSNSLLNYGPVKVFAENFKDCESHDQKFEYKVTRVSGLKLFRKYRKAILVNNYLKENTSIKALIADHWKSLEHIDKKKLFGIKTLCLIHSKEINHPLNSSLNKRVIKSLSKADFIISNSNFTKRLAIDFGVSEKIIKVINPGIDRFKKPNDENLNKAEELLKDSFPRLITVARLDKRKGQDKTIMTIRNLKEKFPKIKYICVGYGDEEENLQKLAYELHLENNVHFLKNINPEYKSALLTKSNLFIMPSIIYKKSVEGFGISFIEAAQHGIPSVGGKDGGESDAILHNKTGLICDGNDLNSIYETVIIFFSNDRFNEFGKAAQKFSENFHWNKIVKNYFKLINE